MKKICLFPMLMLFPLTFAFVACSDDNKEGTSTGTTRVEIRLTDAPAAYDAVYINIKYVSIHVINDDGGGWQDIPLLKPGVYNLLDFQNGIDTLLVGQDIPSGKISQIRLILGEDSNMVVKSGQTYPLETPSAQQSGLKLNLHDELISGITYRLWIDFDASRSIIETGSGKYKLKPVIRTYTQAQGGSLKGTVLPQEAQAVVWAILGTDSILAYPNSDGYFRISGLQQSSSWKVILDSGDATNYRDSTLTGITVNTGQVTDIGTFTLKQY